MSLALENLINLMALEKLEDGLFQGQSEDLGLPQVFGGQVAGQALYAAGQTVPADRRVHSFHSYFLRPGDSHKPIIYDVENLRDGKSFSARRVSAIQNGKPIFYMTASFQGKRAVLSIRMPCRKFRALTDSPLKLILPARSPRICHRKCRHCSCVSRLLNGGRCVFAARFRTRRIRRCVIPG